MTAPTITSYGAGGNSTNVTSHSITLPTSITVGKRIVVVFSVDGAPTVSIDTGVSGSNWSIVGQASQSSVVGAIISKIAEGSDVLTLTTTAGEQATWISMQVDSDGDIYAASATGNSADSNPPNLDPSVGSKDFLWIATRSGDASPDNLVATAAPLNYGDLQTQQAATTAGASTNTATRALTASSEDPGAFTSGSEQWVAWTVAIAPNSATGLSITSVTPSAFDDGRTGIVIAGSGFGASQGSSTLTIGGQAQTVTDWNDSQIIFTSVRGSVSPGNATLTITKG